MTYTGGYLQSVLLFTFVFTLWLNRALKTAPATSTMCEVTFHAECS